MRQLLVSLVWELARIHNRILTLNDAFEYNFTDKQLHFLVIGIIGIAAVLLIHPLFTLLAKTDHILVITFIYVFTLIIVLTFAVEIGQGLSGTGSMDFADIVSGVYGFLLFFLIFAAIRGLVRGIFHLFVPKD